MAIIRYSESIYKNNNHCSSVSGEKEIPKYQIEFPKTGGVRLKKIGTNPIYATIQANKVNCDLHSVLEQCVHQNQLAVCDLKDVNQAIADFSGLSSMSEWYAGVKNLESVWNQTPLEVREQFGSSKAAFMSAIGTDEFTDKLNKGYSAFHDAFSKRIDVPKLEPEITIPKINEESDVSIQKGETN